MWATIKIFSGNIQNFTANPYRSVDVKIQLDKSADLAKVMRVIKERLAQVTHVLTEPAPVVEIQEFAGADPVLLMRPFVHNNYYWQVYFETTRIVREAAGGAHPGA